MRTPMMMVMNGTDGAYHETQVAILCRDLAGPERRAMDAEYLRNVNTTVSPNRAHALHYSHAWTMVICAIIIIRSFWVILKCYRPPG